MVLSRFELLTVLSLCLMCPKFYIYLLISYYLNLKYTSTSILNAIARWTYNLSKTNNVESRSFCPGDSQSPKPER